MTKPIPVMEACERLGISNSSICISAKYKRFYIKSPKDKRAAFFDIEGYLKFEQLKESLVAQVGLLVEYLYYIEEMAYTEIAKLSNISVQQLHRLSFGFETALKIAKAIREFRRFHWKRFHQYYNYKAAA